MSNQADIRHELADIILPSIIKGTPPWRSLFYRGIPTNPLTGKKFTGINPLVLDAVADERTYRSKFWATYKQWGVLGLQVPKRPANYKYPGWGVPIVNWDQHHKLVDKGENFKLEQFHLLQTHTVFNAEQVIGKGLEKYIVTKGLNEIVDYNKAEEVINATKADILHHRLCNTPHYKRPPKDRILLPSKARFFSEAQYMATKLHELAHYSEIRVGWNKSEDHGELLAEIVTGRLESELGLPHDLDITNHIKWAPTWVQKIHENPKYLFDAAAFASRSIDWVLGFTRLQEREFTITENMV